MRVLRLVPVVILLAACPGPSSTWTTVFEGLDQGLVSVAGTSAKDVWTAGGDDGDGSGPLVLHFDGKSWKRSATGVTGDLWWIQPFADGTTYFAGANGHVLEEKSGVFTAMATPGTDTVFGVFGVAKDDLWAVGGNTDAGTGFIWRYDGSAWTPVDAPDGLANTTTFFKVWGPAKNDVWIVGTGGTMLHFDGTALTNATDASLASSERPLFTVHGAGGTVVAVGGYANGFVVERTAGGAFHDASPDGAMALSGVFLTSATTGWAVGAHLSVFERDAKGWTKADTQLAGSSDLHAVWADPGGGVWAVGGDILSLPLTHGTLVHLGSDVPHTISK